MIISLRNVINCYQRLNTIMMIYNQTPRTLSEHFGKSHNSIKNQNRNAQDVTNISSSSSSSSSGSKGNEIKYNVHNHDVDVYNRDESQSHTNNNNKEKSIKYIIIGAGRGATGTHLMTEVTCLLGYPSIHFALGCIPQKEKTIIKNNNNNHHDIQDKTKLDVEKQEPIPSDYLQLYKLTRKITRAVYDALDCSIKKKGCRTAIEFRNFLRNAIQNLILDITISN